MHRLMKKKVIYSEKEKEILEMAFKYKLAYEDTLSKLPIWKQEVVNSNTGQLNNDRIVQEFSREVAVNAEAMK